MTQSERCKKFLRLNGWEYDQKNRGGSGAYIKGNLCAVEIDEDEIVLLDDTGDFAHLPLNYYALVGALMEMRQVCTSYVSAR